MKSLIFFFITNLFIVLTSVDVKGNKDTLRINDSIYAVMERADFVAESHSLQYDENGYLFAINNCPVFGVDGEVPRYVLTKLTLVIGQKKIDLDVSEMYNPWFGKAPWSEMFQCKFEGNNIRFQGFFSDGAGAYGAEWLIVSSASRRTIITNDEAILFTYFKP